MEKTEYYDKVMDELEKLKMPDLANMIISEGRITVESFSETLAQQILAMMSIGVSEDMAAYLIHYALLQVYNEEVKEENEKVN